MQKLIEKVENLKKELDKEKVIIEMKELNKRVYSDKELINLIEEYKITRNEEIKKIIISNPLYLEYKKQENEVNFIILKIRSELKKVLDKESGCIKR